MDLIPTPDRDTIRCFSLGDPDEQAMQLFSELLAAGNMNWNLIIVRNPSIRTLRGESLEAYEAEDEGMIDGDWAL